LNEQAAPEGASNAQSVKTNGIQPLRPGPTAILLGGAALASLVTAAVLQPSSLTPGADQVGSSVGSLAAVPFSEIDQARQTIDLSTGAAAIEEAKSCKAPLAYVQIVSTSPGATATVRIRSGGYLSPAFAVTSSAQRVAIPYPAPYPTGKGVLIVEGQGNALLVSLTPGQKYDRLAGPAPINVVWTPKNPC
jgi:hypothetical protein